MERMDWTKLLSAKRDRITQRLEEEARAEFERDYDRCVFSTPVRRLQDKAQVFPLEPLDAVRTRLTHSLEVSTIARDLGDTVGRWLLKKKHLSDEQEVAAIRSVAAAGGLIHDLGNPPFGHAGEKAIQEWFKRRLDSDKDSQFFSEFAENGKGDERGSQYAQDFLKFEGNAQTIRLVGHLQILSDFHGLNLTYATLSAACKYTAPSNKLDHDDNERKKPGYFASEQELIARIREATGTGDARNPIAFLIEACDDIAYLTVDLEDGVKKQVLDWGTLKDELQKRGVKNNPVKDCINLAEKQIKKGCLSLTGHDLDEAYATAFRVQAIGRMVPAVSVAFQENYESIMMGEYHSALLRESTAASLEQACREVCREFVYKSPETLRLELMGRRVIQDLMDIFWSGVEDWSTDRSQSGFDHSVYNLLSPNYRAVFEKGMEERRLPENYLKLQLVTDYIAGMTDTFACRLHKQLTNG